MWLVHTALFPICFGCSLSVHLHLSPYFSPSLSGCSNFFGVQSLSNWAGIAIYWVFCVSLASTYSHSCLSNIIPPLHKAVLFGIPFWLTRFFLAPHNKGRFEFVYSIYQLIHQTHIGLAFIFGMGLLFSHQSQSCSIHVIFMHITVTIFLSVLLLGLHVFIWWIADGPEPKLRVTRCCYMKLYGVLILYLSQNVYIFDCVFSGFKTLLICFKNMC